MGGEFHLKLNIGETDEQVQWKDERTFESEKVREIVEKGRGI